MFGDLGPRFQWSCARGCVFAPVNVFSPTLSSESHLRESLLLSTSTVPLNSSELPSLEYLFQIKSLKTQSMVVQAAARRAATPTFRESRPLSPPSTRIRMSLASMVGVPGFSSRKLWLGDRDADPWTRPRLVLSTSAHLVKLGDADQTLISCDLNSCDPNWV